jgi:hypothetical protein
MRRHELPGPRQRDPQARDDPTGAARRERPRDPAQFFGWRDNAVNQTLFESRSMLELQGYVAQAGALHLGLYGGGGAAYRWEDGMLGGNSGSLAIDGGALLQLDINTRLAITGRLGQTYGHGERMSDVVIGLAVY